MQKWEEHSARYRKWLYSIYARGNAKRLWWRYFSYLFLPFVLGNSNEAVSYIQDILEFRPSDISALDGVATLLEKQKAWKEAIPLLEKLFKLTKDGDDLDRSCQFMLRRVHANIELVRTGALLWWGRASTRLLKSVLPTSTVTFVPRNGSWILRSVLTICFWILQATWIELYRLLPKS